MDLRRRRDGAAGEEHVVTQSVQVAGEGGSSQSLQVAGGGEISQSAPVTGGGAEEASAVVAGPKTADEMLDEMLEDLNKVEQKPTAAVVKSVRATEAAGSGAMQRLSPEQRRWLANAAEAMMAGQPVELGALPEAQDVQQQTLVPVGEAGQRPHFLPVALPADGHGQAGHHRGDDRGDHGGNDQGRQGGGGLQGVEGRGDDQGQGPEVDQRAQAGGGRLLGPLALPAGPPVDATLALRPGDLPPLPNGPPRALQPLGGRCEGGEPVRHGGGDQRDVRALPHPAEVHAVEHLRPQDGGRNQRDQHGMRTPEVPTQTVEVNPFWSDGAQREARGSGSQQVQPGGGQGTPTHAEQRLVAYDGLSHQDLLEIEAMKMQALREVQEKLKNEMARRRGAAVSGNESGGSYRTAEGNGPSQRMSGLDTPPGLPVQPSYVSPMVQPQGVQQPTPMMMAGTPGVSQPMVVSGEALNESLRTLELPKLTDCSAVEFGDWLAVITPLMSDLNSTSATWWNLTVSAARMHYEQWKTSNPLERLRIQVQPDPESRRYPRTEQRAVTMLLAAVPEQIRRDIVSARKMTCVEIVFTLFCKFQPGGAQERTVLLRELSENRLSANAGVKEILTTLRTWRRNLGRASELGVQLPDPLLLMGLLSK